MNKKMNVSSVASELSGASSFFPSRSPASNAKKPEETQNIAQKVEQVSNPLLKELSTPVAETSDTVFQESSANPPTAEVIEQMSFALRKAKKTKVNTQVAEDWKRELEEMAFR